MKGNFNVPNGKLRYTWQNPNEPHPRKKIILFKYLPEFNWIIASTSYEAEVYSPLQTFRTFIMALLAIMLFFGVILTFFISRSVTKPLDKLIQKLEAGSQGDFSGRMEYESPDELGKVSSHFSILPFYRPMASLKKSTKAPLILPDVLKATSYINPSGRPSGGAMTPTLKR